MASQGLFVLKHDGRLWFFSFSPTMWRIVPQLCPILPKRGLSELSQLLELCSFRLLGSKEQLEQSDAGLDCGD